MKFAFCLFKYFPFGGLQRDFIRIARECIRRGHSVDVFTLEWQGERERGLNIHIVRAQGLQNHTRRRDFIKKVLPLLGPYDKVVGFNKMPGLDVYYAADTCYQAKARRTHGACYRLLPRYRQLVADERAVFGTNPPTEILLLAAKQQEEFSQFYHTPHERFYLLPPGIARDRLAPLEWQDKRRTLREKFELAHHEFLLLFVGSGFRTKGLDRALLSYAALPADLRSRCRFYIIGEDRSRPFLKYLKKIPAADQPQFLGGRHDVADFFLAADLLIHPAYNENTGTVLLEALAAGAPVLTTDVCGYAHYVKTANAGQVLSSPFQQNELDLALQYCLTTDLTKETWRLNALQFTRKADLYSLPERAVDFIERPRLTAKKYDFEQMMSWPGKVYRDVRGRCTRRIIQDGRAYFLKTYQGAGWREIFKNGCLGKRPILSAKNEWQALRLLEKLNIKAPTIASYECRGFNPAGLRSFLMTNELTDCLSLEIVCKNWSALQFNFKQGLLKRIAMIAKALHDNGINHRDFYICHFLLDEKTHELYLIDLHRAEIRRAVPARWLIKDLSGLYFSSKDIGLTQRDYLRFLREYRNKSIRAVLNEEQLFWQKVIKRGDKLYRKQKQSD